MLKKYSFLVARKGRRFSRLILKLVSDYSWLLCNYVPFRHLLGKSYQVRHLKPIKISTWHLGFKYFTGYFLKEKIFIKFYNFSNRVEREIKLLEFVNRKSSLLSKHVPKVKAYDYSTVPFIGFSFIEGELLSALLQEDCISDHIIEQICSQLIKLLDQLHLCNIVHRDIRPANLMVEFKSEKNIKLYLIDFTYSVKIDDTSFHELPEFISNTRPLSGLGGGFNPRPFVWDDAFSVLKILRLLEQQTTMNLNLHISQVETLVGSVVFQAE